MATQRITKRNVVLAALLAAVLSGIPAATGHAPALAAIQVAADEDSALVQAHASGLQVEALSDRTDYAQVFANPDGTFTYQASPVQQRLQQADGTWANVDTTLQQQADGTVVPAASPTRSMLSGGGTAPAVTVWQDDSEGGGQFALSWPGGALPAPSLSGDTATYPGVLSGVDLQVTATDQGADVGLVVNNAQAATNPALAQFSLGLSAPGMSLSADSSGNVTATDSVGDDAFDVQAPLMWDSAAGGSDSDGPGAAVHQSTAAAQLASGLAAATLTLTPDQSLLTGAGTVFPVYIAVKIKPREPSVTVHGPSGGWMDVARDNQGGQWGDWEPTGKLFSNSPRQPVARVGPWCPDDGNGNCVDSYRGEQPARVRPFRPCGRGGIRRGDRPLGGRRLTGARVDGAA